MMTVPAVVVPVVLLLQTVVLLVVLISTSTTTFVVVQASSPIYQVDGSGITNVQECLWDMMHQIETASSIPVRLSYRGLQDIQAVDDGTEVPATPTLTGTQFAEQEFLNSILENVKITSYNDNVQLVNETKSKMTSLPMFVIIDKPISTSLYDAQFEDNSNNYGWDQIAFNGGIMPMNNESASRFIQIPLFASPIGFFHSVPQSSIIDPMIDNDDAGLVWNTSSSSNLIDGNNNDSSEITDADEMAAINDIESIYEDTSAMELYIDACTIMKLYDGTITSWMNVLQDMPSSDMSTPGGMDMKVDYTDVQASPNKPVPAVRVVAIRGKSSATLAVSTYLSQFCPDFPTSRISNDAAVAFPTNTNSINFVNTYEEMMDSLTTNSGSIGYMPTVRTSYNSQLRSNNEQDDLIYLDSPVQEVFIPITKETDSDYATSIDTLRTADGVAVGLDRTKFPTNALYDFKNTELFTSATVGTPSSDPNVDKMAWPMLTVIFAMVPKHLDNLVPDPVERSLLYAFLESFYNIDYKSICYDKYNYASLPDEIETFAKDGIDFVRNEPTNNNGVTQPKWIFESSTSAIADIDLIKTPYLLSAKRKSYTEVIVNDLNNRVNEITTAMEDSEMGLAILEEEIMNMKLHVNDKKNTINPEDNYDVDATTDADMFDEEEEEYLEEIENAIASALVLSSISFTLWMIVGCVFFCRFFYRCYRSRSRKDEQQQQQQQSSTSRNALTNLHDFGTEPDGIFSKGRTSTNGGSSINDSINLNAKRYEAEFLETSNDLELSASVSTKPKFGTSSRPKKNGSSSTPGLEKNGSSTPRLDKTDSSDDIEYGVSTTNEKKAVL